MPACLLPAGKLGAREGKQAPSTAAAAEQVFGFCSQRFAHHRFGSPAFDNLLKVELTLAQRARA